MTATATQTAAQSTAVAAAAEEASSNVGTVAAAAEELGASVQEIGRQVDGSAQLARAAVSEAGQTAGQVRALTEATARIGGGRADHVDRGANHLLALKRHHRAARAGTARARLRRGSSRSEGAGRPDREGDRGKSLPRSPRSRPRLARQQGHRQDHGAD